MAATRPQMAIGKPNCSDPPGTRAHGDARCCSTVPCRRSAGKARYCRSCTSRSCGPRGKPDPDRCSADLLGAARRSADGQSERARCLARRSGRRTRCDGLLEQRSTSERCSSGSAAPWMNRAPLRNREACAERAEDRRLVAMVDQKRGNHRDRGRGVLDGARTTRGLVGYRSLGLPQLCGV